MSSPGMDGNNQTWQQLFIIQTKVFQSQAVMSGWF